MSPHLHERGVFCTMANRCELKTEVHQTANGQFVSPASCYVGLLLCFSFCLVCVAVPCVALLGFSVHVFAARLPLRLPFRRLLLISIIAECSSLEEVHFLLSVSAAPIINSWLSATPPPPTQLQLCGGLTLTKNLFVPTNKRLQWCPGYIQRKLLKLMNILEKFRSLLFCLVLGRQFHSDCICFTATRVESSTLSYPTVSVSFLAYFIVRYIFKLQLLCNILAFCMSKHSARTRKRTERFDFIFYLFYNYL